MVRCITGQRFSMTAEILKWTGTVIGDADDVTPGAWETYQDPITGEVLNSWQPQTESDNPDTVHDETGQTYKIRCVARGIVQGGIRVAGTTERFGDTYENVDHVNMWVPASVVVSKRDQITNIRNGKNGPIVWVDEEYDTGVRATIFNVNGVTPLFDAFNKHIENYVMLEKTQ